VLITEALEAELLQLREPLEPRRSPVRPAEAVDRIALHIGRVIERAVASLDESDRARVGASLARRLVDIIGEAIGQNDLAPERPLESSEVLRALLGRLPVVIA
jgi:hypothetical protein